jgi:hypothetical protein
MWVTLHLRAWSPLWATALYRYWNLSRVHWKGRLRSHWRNHLVVNMISWSVQLVVQPVLMLVFLCDDDDDDYYYYNYVVISLWGDYLMKFRTMWDWLDIALTDIIITLRVCNVRYQSEPRCLCSPCPTYYCRKYSCVLLWSNILTLCIHEEYHVLHDFTSITYVCNIFF